MRIAYIGNFDAEHSTENHVRIALTTNGHDVQAAPGTGLRLGPHQIQNQRSRHRPLDPHRRIRPRRPRPPASQPSKDWMCPSSDSISTVGGDLTESQTYTVRPFFDVDLLFTADGGHDPEWLEAGVNHVWSPPAVSAQEAHPGEPRDEYRSKLGFVGSWRGYHREWPQRQQLIKWAQRTYGSRFRPWPAAGNPAIRGKDLRDLYASIDVVLGDSCLVGSPVEVLV